MESIDKTCGFLGLSDRVLKEAQELYARTCARVAGLRRPRAGLVAGCIYIAAKLADEPRTQFQVAGAVGVTEPTIRANMKIAAPFVSCEHELGERQNGRAFCSVQDNWCSHQEGIWQCSLRKAHASSFQKLVRLRHTFEKRRQVNGRR